MSTRTKTLLLMTCMILLMTILRSHFATNVEEVSTQSRTVENEVMTQHRLPIFQETENILPFLTEETVSRTVQLDGDTREDIIRLRQMQDMDDDLQSQLDLELQRRELPEGEEQKKYRNRENAERVQAAHARHARRREQADRERHQGTAAALQQRYQSLHQQDSINKTINKLENDDQKLHHKVLQYLHRDYHNHCFREEERVQRAQVGGYYAAPPPPPQHYRDKDRLRLHDEEELQRQAAQQEIPDERVVQVLEVQVQQSEEREGEEAQQVDSATTSSTSQSESRHA
eukprot:383463-Amphidinium_carterae.4